MQTLVVIDEAHSLHERTAALHLACCEHDRFFCGADFHPEAEGTEAHDEEDCCPTCVDIRYKMLCPRDRPTHQHCPFDRRVVCEP